MSVMVFCSCGLSDVETRLVVARAIRALCDRSRAVVPQDGVAMRAGMEKLQVADRDEVMIQVGVPSATGHGREQQRERR